MPARRIGDIIPRILSGLSIRPKEVMTEWSFAGYGTCAPCEEPVEWWIAPSGSKVAFDLDGSTFWAEGAVRRVGMADLVDMVNARMHSRRCPDCDVWHGGKQGGAERTEDPLHKIRRLLREPLRRDDSSSR